MPKLHRKRSLLAKIEGSYGSDPTATGSANYVEVVDLEIEPVASDEVEQETIRPYPGNYPVLLANTRVNLSFGVFMVGSGSAGTAPKYDPILKACGLSAATVSSTSVTYTPSTLATQSSVTFYVNYDGVRHKVTGCRGTFSISCAVNEIPRINFEMQGIFNTPTDQALPTVTKSLQPDPVLFKNGNTSSFSVFGFSGALQSWELEFSNEVIYRELVGGTKEALITDRRPSGTMVIEAVALSSKNFFTLATGTTTGTNTWSHSGGAGNIVTVSCPQTDLGQPTYEDSDGITMLNLPFYATPTDAGSDEFSLAFT
tara:strand:- start:816 stop:1754 length:939 start_codon:yes stop_codon:yes gene_type:complete